MQQLLVVLQIETKARNNIMSVSTDTTLYALNLDSDGGGHFVRKEIDDRDAFA